MDTSETHKQQLEVAKRDFPDVVAQGEGLLSKSDVRVKFRSVIVDRDDPVIATRQFFDFVRRRLSASDLGMDHRESTV